MRFLDEMATFVQNDGVSDSLIVCLDLLQKNCSHDQYVRALSTLLKLCRNALDNPTEEKYRSVKIENKSFFEKVWQFSEAQEFLVAAGWAVVDGHVILSEDKYLQSAVRVLEANPEVKAIQFVMFIAKDFVDQTGKTIRPSQSTTGNRAQKSHFGTNIEGDQAKQHVLEENKKKYMEEHQSMLQEKKRISDQIKADRRETSTRVSKDSRARDFKLESNVKKLEDIGINVNKGSG